MFTDTEFVLARMFDRQLASSADSAQSIINRKNQLLVAADREIVRLRAELETERARRRRAEFLLTRN